jgi:hypothetical protein
MNLKVEEDGCVMVVNVFENGAADRASDSAGNRCSIKAKDEIIEINGVSLNVCYFFFKFFNLIQDLFLK